MNNPFPNLITSDANTGLALARNLADQLLSQINRAGSNVERPGGMNYLSPAPVSKELTASILFYAIAAANQGWPTKRWHFLKKDPVFPDGHGSQFNCIATAKAETDLPQQGRPVSAFASEYVWHNHHNLIFISLVQFAVMSQMQW